MAETARYLYAISRGLDAGQLAGTHGLGGGTLEVVQHRGLAAVVSDVDLEEYGEEGLRRNLERLDWLEETARCHDAVVHAVATLGPTAPLRLATICLDDAAVRLRLDEWHTALDRVLDRVAGRSEWSVKVVAPLDDPADDAEPAEDPQAAGAGAAYLQRKRRLGQARAEAEERAVRLADDLYTTLAGFAAASRRLPAQDPRLTGHQGSMILNAAYLVDVGEEARFEARCASLTRAHADLLIDVHGPWPPYSFAMLEEQQ